MAEAADEPHTETLLQDPSPRRRESIMRRQPQIIDVRAIEEAWQAGKKTSDQRVHRYQAKTLTPLYGGGVKAGQVDLELPVRASAIRGQLRFWWRLLQPTVPSEQMFADETALWGGISCNGPTASRVKVRVRQISQVGDNDLAPAFAFPTRHDGTYAAAPRPEPGMNAYALFPAQGKRSETNHRALETPPGRLAKPGITFTLEIECPESYWPEVETALRWWATFGGLGARTRRGLGAVEMQDLQPISRPEVAAVGGRLVLRRPKESAVAAWQESVERLRDFRQEIKVGRNEPGEVPNRPGRSRWPEADMIRRLFDQWEGPDHTPAHPLQGFYPRAAFGLPIVFHFKRPDHIDQNQPANRRQDPADDAILEPQDNRHDRMASPLILRPYPAANGKYHPAALLLPGWEQVLNLDLRFKDSAHQMLATWPGNAEQRVNAAERIRPMHENSRLTDPLSAFLDFFVKEAF
jgi:CRISPR-associated protein Cmr1